MVSKNEVAGCVCACPATMGPQGGVRDMTKARTPPPMPAGHVAKARPAGSHGKGMNYD